jgi:hypothetical protein
MTRVTNKNLHGLTTKKGSKMTKKRGSKKGQKWPKMGVQKRVKKGSKNELFRTLKTITRNIRDKQMLSKKNTCNYMELTKKVLYSK